MAVRTVRRAPSPRRKKSSEESSAAKPRVAHRKTTAVDTHAHTTHHETHHVHAEEQAQPHHHKPAVPSHLVHPDEKRELILAHAHARRAKQPQALGFFYYASITTAAVIVAAGWWLTLGKNLRAGQVASNTPDPIVQIVQQSGQNFSDQWRASSQQLINIEDEQKQYQKNQEAIRAELAKQELLQKTAENIKKNTSSTPDLYNP